MMDAIKKKNGFETLVTQKLSDAGWKGKKEEEEYECNFLTVLKKTNLR